MGFTKGKINQEMRKVLLVLDCSEYTELALDSQVSHSGLLSHLHELFFSLLLPEEDPPISLAHIRLVSV